MAANFGKNLNLKKFIQYHILLILMNINNPNSENFCMLDFCFD